MRVDSGGVMLEIREIFHCDPAGMYCTEDEGLTFEALSQHQGKKLTGRNIIDRALKVVKHYKLFLKFFKEYADANADNPSGLKLEDMCIYVCRKVYVLFRGSQTRMEATRKRSIAKKTCQ